MSDDNAVLAGSGDTTALICSTGQDLIKIRNSTFDLDTIVDRISSHPHGALIDDLYRVYGLTTHSKSCYEKRKTLRNAVELLTVSGRLRKNGHRFFYSVPLKPISRPIAMEPPAEPEQGPEPVPEPVQEPKPKTPAPRRVRAPEPYFPRETVPQGTRRCPMSRKLISTVADGYPIHTRYCEGKP